MQRFVHGEELWHEIRTRTGNSKSVKAAVAYLGRDCFKLIKWPKDSSVVADLSEETVRRGSSSARGALRLMRKGVRIFVNSRLHSKVYLFDKSAIVCSANLSESSEQKLEAGFLTTDKKSLENIRKYINSLKNQEDTYEIEDEIILKNRAKLEPRKPKFTRRKQFPTQKLPISPFHRVWIIPSFVDYSETSQERAAKRNYERKWDYEIGKISWYSNCGRSLSERVKEDDRIILMWEPSKRKKFGWLEGPYRSLGGLDLGAKVGERRYCIPMLRKKTKSYTLDQTGFAKVKRLQGDKRPISQAAKNISTRPKLLTKTRKTRFLSWLNPNLIRGKRKKIKI